MPSTPHHAFLPLYKLPLFAQMVTGMLRDTQTFHTLFLQAKTKPWVLDDATVDRTIRLYTERLDILGQDEEQVRRWKKEQLTPQQQQTIAALSEQLATMKTLCGQLLATAREIKQYTIDRILARDPAELAIDVLTGKLKMEK